MLASHSGTVKPVLTLDIKIVEQKISGEICKSHLLESWRTDFAAANLQWGLSL